MSLLTLKDVALGCAQFIVIPGLLERLARKWFLSTHRKLNAKDAAVLSQRLTRAFIALNLTQGMMILSFLVFYS